MPDFRAYCQPTEPAPAEIRLSPEESHHLVTVNRCGRGDPVTAFDGHGREWLTECVDASKSATVLRVKESRPAATRPFSITLAQALPKGSTMDDIVRQATEVGAARIIPLLSERTQVHLDGDRADKKVEKWRTAAIEAAKQCGNPWLPEITSLQNFSAFLASAKDYDLRLVASLHAGPTTLKKTLATFAHKHGHPPRSALWARRTRGRFLIGRDDRGNLGWLCACHARPARAPQRHRRALRPEHPEPRAWFVKQGSSRMRKKILTVLAIILIAAALFVARPVLFLANVWWHDGKTARPMPAAGTDDASRLNPSSPAEVIRVAAEPAEAERQLSDLVKRAAREGRHVSIVGAQHAMGGHTLYPGGIALDMHPFNRLSLDEGKRLLTAGAGARWLEIIPYLDQRGYAVSIMQTNNDFSVGGSISVNCHGWQNNTPPIASTVESFRIVTASGEVVRCSRTENRELFSLALGGYGLFGVILEVDLRIVPNDFYEAEARAVSPADYVKVYHELTREHTDVGMAYGRISVAPASFMQEAS